MQDNQTIYDIALKYYGQPSLLRIWQLNPNIDVFSDLTGQTILVDDGINLKNIDLVNYFKDNNIGIATN